MSMRPSDMLDRMSPSVPFPIPAHDPSAQPTPTENPLGPPGLGGLDDFYPVSLEEHMKLLKWCTEAYRSARTARLDHDRRWKRLYRQYRSWVRRVQGDWHSKVFVPIPFWIVEAILPRLVANLPEPIVKPMGPDDVVGAKAMERLERWAWEESNTYIEQVVASKSSIMYGTGILKTFYREDIRKARRLAPGPAQPRYGKMDTPVPDPQNPASILLGPDGQPVVETKDVLVGWDPGPMSWQQYTYPAYEGPACEALDIFNFWVAPEATSIQGSRYVIHRVYREWSYVQRRIEEGVFQLPPGFDLREFFQQAEEPHLQRLAEIGFGVSPAVDPTRQPIELLEFWDDEGRVTTMANQRVILRCHENPFDHGEKPFVRIVDHLVPHEFWGLGELESIEGLVDLVNALTNQRIDNVRLAMNKMLAINIGTIVDAKDLRWRPGGTIRLRGDIPPREALMPLDIGDVTASSYHEVDAHQMTIEKVSGVSGYALGTDSPGQNDTATGVGLIMEAGSTRFSLKTRLQELMGLKDLARHYGSNLLQFTTKERLIRILGPDGEYLFETYSPEALQGSYDYDIEPASSVQTVSQKRSDAMNLLQTLANYAPQAIPKLSEDVLEAFDKKDITSYLGIAPGLLPPGLGVPPGGTPGMPGAPQGLALPPGGPSGGPTASSGPPGPPAPGLPAFQAPQPVQPQQRSATPPPGLLELLQKGPAR